MELPITVDVEMSLFATVTITEEICMGIKDQYPETWARVVGDPEEIAKLILYASVGRYCQGNNDYDDVWDGVGDMAGLIKNMDLE